MASKSTRRSATTKPSSVTRRRPGADDDYLEDALAFEHGFYREGDEGYLARGAARVRELTREREGQVVIAALATGFTIGVLIGGVIASSHERHKSWTDRLACEGLGRRLLDRLGNVLPESISERLGA